MHFIRKGGRVIPIRDAGRKEKAAVVGSRVTAAASGSALSAGGVGILASRVLRKPNLAKTGLKVMGVGKYAAVAAIGLRLGESIASSKRYGEAYDKTVSAEGKKEIAKKFRKHDLGNGLKFVGSGLAGFVGTTIALGSPSISSKLAKGARELRHAVRGTKTINPEVHTAWKKASKAAKKAGVTPAKGWKGWKAPVRKMIGGK